MKQFVITTGPDGADEIILKLSASDALLLATRFLNQLDLRQPDQKIVAILKAGVEVPS